MKVIITQRFEKEFLFPLKKYFKTEDFILALKNKSHTFIFLNSQFFKIKNKINFVDFRWFLAFIENDKIIPLFIFPKKDKKYWENISWKNNEKLIESEFDFSVRDIENWNFNEY